ncbi:MAG: membrane biogenesis protein, partial [Cyclobacteriaceae bacterium]
SKVLFDTLQNQLDLNKGTLTIPKMIIQSTLGFIEISGKQDMNMNMEYYLRIPLRLVTKVGMMKLFGKKEVNPDEEDEIQYMDDSKRTLFVNVKLTGTPDNYTIGFGRDKAARR